MVEKEHRWGRRMRNGEEEEHQQCRIGKERQKPVGEGQAVTRKSHGLARAWLQENDRFDRLILVRL